MSKVEIDAALGVKSVFIWVRRDEGADSKATINVPGLGDVEIEHALSVELTERIISETTTALRMKLGQVITDNDKTQILSETK